MSARGLVHNDTFIFDGTNFDTWKIYVLNIMRGISPDMEQILDMGFLLLRIPKIDPLWRRETLFSMLLLLMCFPIL